MHVRDVFLDERLKLVFYTIMHGWDDDEVSASKRDVHFLKYLNNVKLGNRLREGEVVTWVDF